MAEVLCLSHLGIRCAVPSRQILSAGSGSQDSDPVSFWKRSAPAAAGERALRVTTASGPRWIRGSDVQLARLEAAQLRELSPLLRAMIPLSHIVGLAEVEGELIWLVDASRFDPGSESSEQLH